ncbi:ImmA/IrrE family metallo-endopeptidase [Tsukamurella pseudospumae]|uniref:ImmA/IrrE family metallo-endopeptidase n=1 Tax=Tsukamurella pseudospumae TaxID=239498 RepID=UPI000B31F13F|nr:ImmA/IrrE family metallo-endopeptidase [Tsukamurella pseudospumae]
MRGSDRPTRAVRSVVRAVTPSSGSGPVTIAEVVAAYADYLGRRIDVQRMTMPVGVFGMWLRSAERDLLVVSTGVATFEQTLAHELGHLVLGHDEGCSADPDSGRAAKREEEAESFATLLVRRVKAGHTLTRVDSVVDELLG